jgi:hypothetical protein
MTWISPSQTEKGKSTAVHYVEIATGCKVPGLFGKNKFEEDSGEISK